MEDIEISKNHDETIVFTFNETIVFTFKRLDKENCSRSCVYDFASRINLIDVDAVFVYNFGLNNSYIDGEAINIRFDKEHLDYVKELVGEK